LLSKLPLKIIRMFQTWLLWFEECIRWSGFGWIHICFFSCFSSFLSSLMSCYQGMIYSTVCGVYRHKISDNRELRWEERCGFRIWR
jgi:hypothetical protein